MPRRIAGAREKQARAAASVPSRSSYEGRMVRRALKGTIFEEKVSPERKILSPLEKSEVGVKRLRDAIKAVRAAKGDKVSY